MLTVGLLKKNEESMITQLNTLTRQGWFEMLVTYMQGEHGWDRQKGTMAYGH